MTSNKKLYVIFGAALFFAGLSLIVPFVVFYDVDHILVVHFDAFRGIDFLGTKNYILGFGATAVAMALINIILSWFLYNRDRFLSWALALGGLGISILALASSLAIIWSN